MPANLIDKTARGSFFWITLLRCVFISLAAFALEGLAGTGTSPYALALAATVGTAAGGIIAFSRIRAGGFLILLLAMLLFYQGLFALLDLPGAGEDNRVFALYSTLQHVNLCYLAALLAAVSAWFFWKYSTAATIELILIAIVAISLLSGHRNFHFEAPLALNDLAWRLHISQLAMLIWCGAAVIVLALLYFYLATLPGRPVARATSPSARAYSEKSSLPARILALGLCALAFYLICSRIYRHYGLEALTRTANGVGQEKREGLSPLGFHSALGATNQPAALVRLEGDYPQNPFSPMLYLRESALSAFNGHELVIAPREFDKDIPAVRPEDSFTAEEDPEIQARTAVIQSIYLLAEHKNAFALDYPVSLVRLKNPDLSRFKSAYRAYSIAPAFAPESIMTEAVGDPRWSPETLQHYLYPHPDSRYREISLKVTGAFSFPVEKMRALAEYLSRNATYTLTPNHQVQPDEDPVAPFLFGDLRGYCVHFAHALVYMARAAGLPARIATGYLTDLSQSKDGHILLRMSDRHAWAELYVSGRGWIPFDVRPDKVESHAESPVDMRILEELMGLLGPGEELLPDSLVADEPRMEEPPAFYVPAPGDILTVLACILLLFLLFKAWLRMGWLLPGKPAFKLRRSYIAVVSILHDLGYRRQSAETRKEFLIRMSRELQIEIPRLFGPINMIKYADPASVQISTREIARLRSQDLEALRSFSRVKRICAFFNPASLMAAITGGGW